MESVDSQIYLKIIETEDISAMNLLIKSTKCKLHLEHLEMNVNSTLLLQNDRLLQTYTVHITANV